MVFNKRRRTAFTVLALGMMMISGVGVTIVFAGDYILEGGGGHATADGAAFDNSRNNYIDHDFTDWYGDILVSGGGGGDAALSLGGSGVSVGGITARGGDGVAGGVAAVRLASDVIATGLNVIAGSNASGGDAFFNGGDHSLTLKDSNGTSLVVDSADGDAFFRVRDLVFAHPGTHTVSLYKGSGALDFAVTGNTVVESNTKFTGYDAGGAGFSLGNLVIDGTKNTNPNTLTVVTFNGGDASGALSSITVIGGNNGLVNGNNGDDLDMAGKTLRFDVSGVYRGNMLTLGSYMKTDAATDIFVTGLDGASFGRNIVLVTATSAGSEISAASQSGQTPVLDFAGNRALLGYRVEQMSTGARTLTLVPNYLYAPGNWTVNDDVVATTLTDRQQYLKVDGTLTFTNHVSDIAYRFGIADNAGGNSVFDINRINVAANRAVTLVYENNQSDPSTGSYGRIGEIELQRDAELIVRTNDAGIWTGDLIINDNATLGSNLAALSLAGKHVTANLTAAFDPSRFLLGDSFGGSFSMDETTVVTINADDDGRRLLEEAVYDNGGYAAVDSANMSSPVEVVLSSGFYSGFGYFDNATGQLMARGSRLFTLDVGSSQNPLMASSAMAGLLAGSADAVGRAADTFVAMGNIGGECSGIHYGAFGYGSYNRYRAGLSEYLRSSDFHLVAGPGVRLVNSLGTTDAGVFFEGGWGGYDAHTGDDSARFHGDGDSRYLGAGLLLRHSGMSGWYGEASLRGGQARNTYKGLKTDRGTTFVSRSGYYGVHGGVGYVLRHDEAGTFDFGIKGFWSGVGGDAVVTQEGQRIWLDRIESSRIQTAVKYMHNFGILSARVMMGWEYEFDGRAGGRIDTERLRQLDTFRGHSGLTEIGVIMPVGEKASLDLGVHASVGARRGWGGSIRFGLGF